ncbi:MAG: triose-phosphate isomerase [Collinsella sp.]|nr:triose-phosphate isomerase [Collinsella sp.]
MAAGDKFRTADVDLVILQLLTYATSYNMLPAVRDLDVPVVLVNVQKKKAPDYANTDTPTWLGELYACGAVGEMVADLERAGKRHAVITGVVEGGDPAVQAEINDWCKAAQVRRRFRDTNLAQIGRPYPGMMDLYIDETNLYNRMWLYTKQFDWEKMWAIADNITDEDAIRAKAQDILDTFDIEGGGTVEKVWDMARYVVAFEQWVKDEKIAFVASHYDGFAQGKAGVLDSMLIPAFSMLIKQGVACAVEGDIKVSMAMSILKTISGCGQLSEMYSIDFNEDICIIGHSERRDYFHETDEDQNKKAKALVAAGLVPVFCCGESLEVREAGTYVEHVVNQVKAGLAGLEITCPKQVVVAYEPIWAIGTGKTATAEDAQEVCGAIRETLKEMFGEELANGIRVLYGGSAKPGNIAELVAKPDVDGALVGGASLKAADFASMVVKAGE